MITILIFMLATSIIFVSISMAQDYRCLTGCNAKDVTDWKFYVAPSNPTCIDNHYAADLYISYKITANTRYCIYAVFDVVNPSQLDQPILDNLKFEIGNKPQGTYIEKVKTIEWPCSGTLSIKDFYAQWSQQKPCTLDCYTPSTNSKCYATTSLDINNLPQESSLTITKTANPNIAIAGGALTYSVVITNIGSAPATGVTIADTLPNGVNYQSSSCSLPATITIHNGVVSCSLTNALASGASATLTINVQVPSPATMLSNLAVADSDQTQPVQCSLETPVGELGIVKTANPSTAIAGSALAYSVVVTNKGSSVATGVTITDTLPSGVSYQSASCSLPATITQSNGAVSCSLTNSLAAGASA
ncbi:MAG: DUF11 domain-containing protein, partial [Methanothrix sp.]|nr:DUF11 domain-containing protein [Methanothrix sp.]